MGHRRWASLLTALQFFNVWASAASVHDAERGVKRLQTRERYVKISEQSLSQKKKHRESCRFLWLVNPTDSTSDGGCARFPECSGAPEPVLTVLYKMDGFYDVMDGSNFSIAGFGIKVRNHSLARRAFGICVGFEADGILLADLCDAHYRSDIPNITAFLHVPSG